MAYNSKYTGAEVDALLDKVAENDVIRIDSALSTTSENAVQNQVVTKAINSKIDEAGVQQLIALEHIYFLYDIENNKVWFKGINVADWTQIMEYALTVTLTKPLTPHMTITQADNSFSVAINDFWLGNGANGAYLTWVYDNKKYTLTFNGVAQNITVEQSEKQGVLSQKQVWTQAADLGYDYTIANVKRGIIPQANIDLLKSNGVTFNEQSGYFECGAVKDLPYEEAMNVLAKTNAFAQGATAVSAVGLGCVTEENGKYRTNLPLLPYRWYMYSSGTFGYLCWNNQYLEILNLENRAGMVEISGNMHSAFSACKRLKKIENTIKVRNVTEFSESFKWCYSLESVRLDGIKKNISFSDSARLDNASILYMIQNAGATGITITLHPTAYARAEADAAIQAAKASKGVSLASA